MINSISILLGTIVALFVLLNLVGKLNSRNYGLLILCFLIGSICVIPANVLRFTALEMGVSEKSGTLFGKIGSAAFFSFIQEFNKYIVIIAFAYKKKEFDEPLAAIIITLMIAMGFTTASNALHIFNGDDYSDTWRMITSVPMAIVCAIIMGFYSGQSKYGLDTDDINSFLLRIRGLFLAVLFHTFYQFFLFMEEYQSLMILIVIAVLVAFWVSISLLIKSTQLHIRLISSRRRKSKLVSDQSPLFGGA